MASFVEEATLKLNNKASLEVVQLNNDILRLIRDARKLNNLKISFGAGITRSQRQVSNLARSLNALPKSRTVTINVKQNGSVPKIPPMPRQGPPPPPPPRQPPPGNRNPPPGGGNNRSPWRNGTFAGVVRIATAYATFTGAVNIARTAVNATNDAQAQDTRELSILRNDPDTRNAIDTAGREAALATRRIDETRGRGIATDLSLGGVKNQNLPQFTTLFANTESAIGALFPGLEKSVTLFNNKMINLANASDDIKRSADLVRGGAQGIAAAGESFNGPTTTAALRGAGIAPTINEKGLANFILLTDAMGQNIASGVTRLRKELFIPTEQAGAGSGISKGTVANLNDKGLRDYTTEQQKQFSQDPASFIEKVLAPRIKNNGVDTNDRAALQKFIESAGFNATSQRLIMATLTSVEERAQQLKTVSGLNPSDPNVGTEKNLALATDDLAKSFNTFSAHVLTPLFEATAPLVQRFSDFVERVALGGSKVEQLGLAAGVAAAGFATFAAGKGLIGLLMNPLTASATALDGSAAALTRAAVALGADGALGDAAGAAGKKGSKLGKVAGFAATVTLVGGAASLLTSSSSEKTPEELDKMKASVNAADATAWWKDPKWWWNAPPPAPASGNPRINELLSDKAAAEDRLSFAKQSGDVNLIPPLQAQLDKTNAELSTFDQTFQTSAATAGTTLTAGLTTGIAAGADALTGGLAGAFAAGADVLAASITSAIASANITIPRLNPVAPANTGATSPTE